MKGSTTIVARIVLLTPHIVKGDSGVSWNLWRIFRLVDEGAPSILERGLGNDTLREAPGASISFSFVSIDPLQPN